MSDTIQVALRLEKKQHNQVKEHAITEQRSLHSQIVYILQAWFDPVLLRRRLEELEFRTQ